MFRRSKVIAFCLSSIYFMSVFASLEDQKDQKTNANKSVKTMSLEENYSLNDVHSQSNLPYVSKWYMVQLNKKSENDEHTTLQDILSELNKASLQYWKDLDRMIWFRHYYDKNSNKIREIFEKYIELYNCDVHKEDFESEHRHLVQAYGLWVRLHSVYKHYQGYLFG